VLWVAILFLSLMIFSYAQRAEAQEAQISANSDKDRTVNRSMPMATPIVVSAMPDTVVDEDSLPIDNLRDLNDVFSDVEDGTALEFTVFDNDNPTLVNPTINGADSTLDLEFTADASGSATIVIRAEDSGSLTVDDTLVVTVTPVNDAPTLSSFAAVVDTVAEDTEVEITFAELAAQGNEADVDGTVDAIATDHAPHTPEEKEGDKPPPGVPGLVGGVPSLHDDPFV